MHGGVGVDLTDEAVIVDWITENPTTASEASGAGVPSWRYALEEISDAVVIPGVDSVGYSRSLKYKYVQPYTHNSRPFAQFLDKRSANLAGLEGPSRDVILSEFVPPSVRDLYEHISGYGLPGPDGSLVSDSEFALLLRELATIERRQSRISGWLDPAMLPKISVPSNTSPGIRWKKLGYRSKKDALMPALVEATRMVKRMVESGEEYSVPPCAVAGRGKRVQIDRDTSGTRKEGRLIVMPDLARHLVGTMASGTLASETKRVDKSEGGILLGMGPFSDSYSQISQWCEGAGSFLFLDFKGFDQKVPARVLSKAFLHMQSAFEKEPGSAAYWRSEFRQLVHTEVVMPGGYVYRKHRGVASGDPWTSLAGSYSNWLMLSVIAKRLGIKTKIWTFGDDSIIAIWGSHPPRILDRFKEMAWDLFGMVVSAEKSYYSRNLTDIESSPTEKVSGSFLSMYFLETPMGVRPTRPLQDVYELMLVPERVRDDIGWEIVRTSMAYLVFYYNEDARYLLEEYWDYLHSEYRVPELTGSSRDIELLRQMDIPWSSFKLEWLNRLPWPGEVELLYKYGHTGFHVPILWGVWYSGDDDPYGNQLSFDPRVP
ncbi:putative RNA-dependent RNA polymerase [Combu double-strand RNA mycovirus]|uniref:Putative RNA-dependent RNA polymerase n=1 Tax=Combu double-strand RNA mycovirus TaxID=2507518 RepID=A0A451G5T6_9VIRU|nr:putative RNA-dependent RNA polymerase [Combu double-strand RNA mycovirus]